MAELELIELEQKGKNSISIDSDVASNQSNQEELTSFISSDENNDQNNASNVNRRQLASSSKTSTRIEPVDEQQITEPTKHSGIPGAVVNFVNSIIGAGIIGLPSALLRSGFVFGIFLMLMVAIMIDWGVRHLIDCGIKVRKNSYEEVMQYAFGNKGYYIASISKLLFAYGAMIAYHVVIGDTIPKIFQTLYPGSIFTNRALVVSLYSIIFMLPLSLLKNMASLDKTSSISIIAVIIIVITVTVEATQQSENKDLSSLDASHYIINKEWFAGAGTMAFAFVCHHNSFIVYNSLENNTQKRWIITTHSSLGISVFFSLWLAIVGFFCFQLETKGDILENFKYDDPSINFARALLALTMVFTFPMEQFVARHCILQMLKLNQKINTKNENKCLFYTLTIILWGTSCLIGASTSNLRIVLELVGVISGALIGFILPGLVSLRVFGWNHLRTEMFQSFGKNNSKTCYQKWIAIWNFAFPIFMILFGVVVMIMGLVTVFLGV